MARRIKVGLFLAGLLILGSGVATAQNREEHAPAAGARPPAHAAARRAAAPMAHRPPAPHGEPHPGPSGYTRAAEPEGWNRRPATINRDAYRHNYQAARTYHIGPYYRPRGWVSHHWAYGQILPRAYWAPQYHLADYWLFGLEVPPPGYEWVRDDDDALLVDLNSGEIVQVEYGVFA